jgi:hypothetical protein
VPGYLGQGFTNGEVVYVPIPKNGSSSHNSVFGVGWTRINFSAEACDLLAYIPVRHPIDRWFAGTDTYSRRMTRPFDDLVADAKAGGPLVFDEHTMRQSDYILSTLHNIELVRLESSARYVADNFGLELPHIGERINRAVDETLHAAILDFYAEDLVLYRQAMSYGSQSPR